MDKWAPGLVGRWEDGKVNEYKNDSMDSWMQVYVGG